MNMRMDISKRQSIFPLSELRERIDEIPRDVPVYLHCRTGQRSYNAVLALQNLGYQNVYNITGSFLGVSFYEYYNDQTKDRESIRRSITLIKMAPPMILPISLIQRKDLQRILPLLYRYIIIVKNGTFIRTKDCRIELRK